MIKISLAQPNLLIGDFENNTNKIIDFIQKAKSENSNLVVFPELSVCGYPPQDFLEFRDFIKLCENSVLKIASHCHGIAAIVGAPSVNHHPQGKNLFNSAFFLSDRKIQQIAHKALLPTYDIFDEYRYFEPGRKFEVVHFMGYKIALTICEDIWDIDNDPLYTVSPMKELSVFKPDLAINISASPFSFSHAEKRKKVLKYWSEKFQIPMIYSNHTGAQTELIFDGGSMVSNANGEIVFELNYFEEDLKSIQFPLENDVVSVQNPSAKEERIYKALVLGIKDYFKKQGFQKAVLGLSGGIDSALTAVLAADALGAENLHGILMPSEFSSDHSIKDAEELAKNLGCTYDILAIRDLYESFNQSLHPIFGDLPFDLAEENLQARIRGTLLMAYSNKFNRILLNTSNKSENAVGYGTLYGDMCGGISVLGDVYKTEVYALSHFINRNSERIPENSIWKAPSAELRPGQKDSDSLPDYDILDQILFQYIELRQSPSQIVAQGFNQELVLRVLKMVNRTEYKRKQTAPILRVSDKAFGHGRRLPIVGKYLA